MKSHLPPVFAAAPRENCDGARVPVAIVGAGPVGLSLAIDLAQRDIPVVVLDDDDTVSTGSRAICWAKHTLEIFDRLGVGESATARGVRWNTGRVFFGDAEVYAFDLAPEPGHRRPAFINLQQYHVEAMLVARAQQLPQCDLRFRHRCTNVASAGNCVQVDVTTPEGPYTFHCDWLVACDGAHSAVRKSLGVEAAGQVFRDRFLIADIRMQSAFPAERWFWFDPPFHRNQSALLHRQADDVWRLDFQLGEAADAEAERQPGNVAARVRAMLGDDVAFDIEWASVYTFSCRRMARFRHGNTLFAGDAAHLVSPFGARGANSGVQDADNLGWKLARVIRGESPAALLDTYDAERGAAADENILHSTRATDFISPKSPMSQRYRDAVLRLARRHPFARQWINSGRLSVATVLAGSALNTPDTGFTDGVGVMVAGAVAADAPVASNGGEWLIDHLGGRFVLLMFDAAMAAADVRRLRETYHCDVVAVVAPTPALSRKREREAPSDGAVNGERQAEPAEGQRQAIRGAEANIEVLIDIEGRAARRYDARPGSCYLVRPDQHICARWRAFDMASVIAAIDRATAHDGGG
ncbi:MAG: FAD-dependent oxidoreductase [Betaproteobacteria bacterium]